MARLARRFDASDATGKQTITWGGNFAKITGGSADDALDLSGSFLGAANAAKTVDGGDGTDSVTLTGNIANLTAAASGTHSFSNIELAYHANTVTEAANADSVNTVAIDKLGPLKCRCGNY